MNQDKPKRGAIVTIGAIIIVLVLAWVAYRAFSKTTPPTTTPDITTSSTTTGTNTVSTEGWQTYASASSSLAFKYPQELGTKYIKTVDWPPQVMVMDAPYSCTQAGNPTVPAGQTKEVTVNGKVYCMTVEEEGAAGSIYSQYAFSFMKGTKLVIMTFTLRRPQCGNYPDPQMTECTAEEKTFDLTGFVDKIAATITIS